MDFSAIQEFFDSLLLIIMGILEKLGVSIPGDSEVEPLD